MLKKIIILFSVPISFFAFFSCKTKKPLENLAEITLVMAEVNPEGTISAAMDAAFKEKVEELSAGKIKIDLQFGGTLGDEESVMKVLMGANPTIHLERISAFNLASYGCEKSSLLVIPFTFASKEHFWKFANSAEAQAILDESYEKKVGVKGLFFGEEGFRHFFATKPLSGTADFEGINLRITAAPIMRGVAEGLKSIPVSVGFADLYSALQTGIADAAEQPIANYLANRFHEVAPYMILDGHTLGVTEVVISSEIWDSLSESQQKILSEAGKYAGEVCRKFSQEAEESAKERLLAEGASFTEVSDLKPWQEASSKIIEESASVAPDLYREVLDLAN